MPKKPAFRLFPCLKRLRTWITQKKPWEDISLYLWLKNGLLQKTTTKKSCLATLIVTKTVVTCHHVGLSIKLNNNWLLLGMNLALRLLSSMVVVVLWVVVVDQLMKPSHLNHSSLLRTVSVWLSKEKSLEINTVTKMQPTITLKCWFLLPLTVWLQRRRVIPIRQIVTKPSWTK